MHRNRLKGWMLATGIALSLGVWAEAVGDDDVSGFDAGESITGVGEDRFEYNPRPDTPLQHKHGADKKGEGKSIWERSHLTDDWFGARPGLDEKGIAFEFLLTIDYSKNFTGGADTAGEAWRHLFNAGMTLDFERLIGHKGGTFFVNFQTRNGPSGSEEAGDIQALDNIDADVRTQISELWFEQKFFEELIRVKIGKVDANSEFGYVETAGDFLNTSFGMTPTLFAMPTYPDPAMSVNLFVQPCEWFYIGFGLYDGAGQEGVRTGRRGPRTFFASPSDYFMIAEAGARWSLHGDDLPGRLALGGWRHNGRFTRFDGGGEHATEGFYIVLEQAIFRENPDVKDDHQGIGLFAQYGWADEKVSSIGQHLGAGMAWTGFVPGRDADVTGLGVTHVILSDEAGAGFIDDSETAIEAFHKFQITEFFSVKLDLQYIADPGGAGLDDALVGTVRIEISF